MTKVVLMNGPPRCGKDLGASHLVRRMGFVEYKFSAPLKRAIPAFFNQTYEYLEAHKDEPLECLQGRTFRQWQISMSEDWIKPVYGDKFFGKVLGQQVQTKGEPLVVVSDSGFLSEYEGLLEYIDPTAILLLQIERDGRTFEGDSRGYLPLNSLHPKTSVARVMNHSSVWNYVTQLAKAVSMWLRDS